MSQDMGSEEAPHRPGCLPCIRVLTGCDSAMYSPRIIHLSMKPPPSARCAGSSRQYLLYLPRAVSPTIQTVLFSLKLFAILPPCFYNSSAGHHGEESRGSLTSIFLVKAFTRSEDSPPFSATKVGPDTRWNLYGTPSSRTNI